MKLFIDIGNTMTRFAVMDNEHIADYRQIKTREFDESFDFSPFLEQDIEEIYYSSVVPFKAELMVDLLIKAFKVKPIEIETDFKTSYKIDIDNRKELGIDLFCDLEGAFKEYGPATLVVDLGTASKFLLLSDKGVFSTCAIVPGVELMGKILHTDTALLPDVDIDDIKPITECHNTVDVLKSSIFYSHLDVVKGMIDRYQRELGYNLKVVFTGGNAAKIYEALDNDSYLLDKYLIFKGMHSLSERN